MKEVGLQPSDTGEPGGKETGQKISHYVMAAGPYAQAYTLLKETGFALKWQSRHHDHPKRTSKLKYTCPGCGLNAWAKPDAVLLCGNCYEESSDAAVTMLAEPEE